MALPSRTTRRFASLRDLSPLHRNQKLAKKWRQESIEEMQHADRLMERMIFLDGMPNMQKLERLHIGHTVKEVIDNDLE
jgi:bacterioferritin